MDQSKLYPLLKREEKQNIFLKSNTVTIRENNKAKRTIYLPAYLTFLIRSLQDIKPRENTITIKYTLVIRILAGNELEQDLINFIGQRLRVNINEETIIPADNYNNDIIVSGKETASGEKYIPFIFRGTFTTTLDDDFYWTPFDVLNIHFKVNILDLKY